ncbi:MAG: NAD(P)/FAD-dependent oxidoreductase [Thermoplasmata archaeon]
MMIIDEGDVLEYDVLVVGGGPVGCAAARYASKNGAKTLVIEKRQEIGSPVRCGEGVSLNRLDDEIANIDTWAARDMIGAKLYSPSGHMLEITEKMAGDEVGVVCERDLFDKEMARLAAAAGADFMVKTTAKSLIVEDGFVKGVKARMMGKDFEIRAKLTIGADGFESQVGRWAGIYDAIPPQDIMTCFQYRMAGLDIDPDYTHFYLCEHAPGGYAWAFPKSEDTANVGLGVQLSRLDGGKSPKDYLDEFIENHDEFNQGEPIDMVAGAVSVTHPPEKVTAAGIMLVGDASRVVDPMTGGGIVNGVIQGRIAGKFAAKAVKEGRVDEEFLQGYEKEWRDELENKLWRNYMAKETAMKLNNEQFDKIVDALSDMELAKVSIGTILEGVQKKYPELVEEFKDLL